jgi:hypothetical protein
MTNDFLNLTNANPLARNMPLAIRKELILTIHANLVTRDDGTVEMVTYLFGPPHGTWEVLETHEYIMKQLNRPNNNPKKIAA